MRLHEEFDVRGYWQATGGQNPEAMARYLHSDARVRWHNTNECFTREQFIQVNCQYPGEWLLDIQRVEIMGDLVVTVVRLWTRDNALSFHATSFLRIRDGLIVSIDEYWGEDGPPPAWRQRMALGTPIWG